MPRPLRLSLALFAVTSVAACGREEVASDPSPVEVVEVDPAENVNAPLPVAEAAPAPATPAAPEPPIERPADVSDAAIKAQITPMLASCLETGDAARGVSNAMGGCFRDELRRQDAQLNAAYKAAMDRLGTTGKTWLRDEERKWIAQRDETCEEARTGGTIDMVEVPSCLVDETIRRRIVLQGMAG